MVNFVKIPMYEFNVDGSIKPNPIFHRSWDKLHSRCIEYPFAASKVEKTDKILDIGTAKADKAWCDWLDNLPSEVHATDYDDNEYSFKNVIFHQADVRQLPYENDTFDKILAVSVIEHIGLDDAQVNIANKPKVEKQGDIEAVRELIRVLKPNGILVMTFPLSKQEFIFADSARVYSMERVELFNSLIEPLSLEYYEYQHASVKKLYVEYEKKPLTPKKTSIFSRGNKQAVTEKEEAAELPNFKPEIPGMVTWRKLPYQKEFINSEQHCHIDGVLCGVWQKKI
ncbi:class I SAM-dependent methyltransferase [Bernardetia sp.]|uniref:class I SAM-dependent methyltransferase n=1 Tax=Bernardetia sp. TaxID=1937974 RepID=UPI0025BD5BBC|nr:class I SAM-dependent methyltransferase [Bernardetia sp.]